VLAKIYPAREEDIYGVSSQDVADEVRKYGTDVIYIDTFSGIEDYLYSHCSEGDLLITMGAGNVTTIGPSLLAR
jgi:UDP-N-acetylmuramate--alanine ligase